MIKLLQSIMLRDVRQCWWALIWGISMQFWAYINKEILLLFASSVNQYSNDSIKWLQRLWVCSSTSGALLLLVRGPASFLQPFLLKNQLLISAMIVLLKFAFHIRFSKLCFWPKINLYLMSKMYYRILKSTVHLINIKDIFGYFN